MPSRSELPGEIKRRKFLRALKRVGFQIDTKGGKGSHYKAKHSNGKSITIPQKLHKATLYYVLKEIEKETGVNWNKIKEEL